MGHKIDTVLQKLKPEEKAKNFVCALLHVGAGALFISAVAVTAMQVASHFSEKAGEMVGKLGSEKLFYFTVAVGALTAIAGIAYFALYLKGKTDNKQLISDNETLANKRDNLKKYINAIVEGSKDPNTKLLDVFNVEDSKVSIKDRSAA